MGFKSDEARNVKYCDNTAVALLFYDNGELTIEYQSDNSHLSQETSTFARQKWWRVAAHALSENLRYEQLDEIRDSELLESFRLEFGEKTAGNKEYTALHGNESAGFVGLDTDRESADNAGWISRIYLKPEFRGRGFSVQLVGLAISEFRRLKRERLRIEAPSNNRVVNLCYDCGFEVVSESGELTLMEKNIKIW